MLLRLWSAIALMIYLVAPGAQSATRLYVDPTATGLPRNGASWQNAYTSIGQALAAMPYGGEIWVKAGTYRESLTLKAYTKIYGGFLGTESSPDQRPGCSFPTIISGGRQARVIDMPADSRVTLDGLVIRDGKADRGAGIRCGTGAVVAISNCRVENCVATDRGGGIYLSYYVTGTVENCVISRNKAGRGAGLVVEYHCYPTLSRNLIVRNHATVSGGGVFCPFHSGALLNNCTLAYNSADLNGGAVYAYYGGPVTLNYCIVAFNSAPEGAGLFADGGAPSITLTGCNWYGNSVGNLGGRLTTFAANSGNFVADPLFLQPEADEFHLRVGSLCGGVGAFELDSVYAVDRVGVAKAFEDGVSVKLTHKLVVHGVDDIVYAQEPDRSSALAIRGVTGCNPGDILTVSGIMSTSGADRVLDATTYSTHPGATMHPKPLGCRLSWISKVAGMLAQTWGRVDGVTQDGFVMRDGQYSAQVRWQSVQPKTGDFVIVTGVCGIENELLARTVRVIH